MQLGGRFPEELLEDPARNVQFPATKINSPSPKFLPETGIINAWKEICTRREPLGMLISARLRGTSPGRSRARVSQCRQDLGSKVPSLPLEDLFVEVL